MSKDGAGYHPATSPLSALSGPHCTQSNGEPLWQATPSFRGAEDRRGPTGRMGPVHRQGKTGVAYPVLPSVGPRRAGRGLLAADAELESSMNAKMGAPPPVSALLYELLPRAMAAELLSVVAPSIRLMPRGAPGEPRRGACRIGGLPDLPPGMAWPFGPGTANSPASPSRGPALPFLAQINLGEVHSLVLSMPLPPSRMLYFFFRDAPDSIGGDQVQGGVGTVLYRETGSSLHRADAPPSLPRDEIYDGFDVEPRLEFVLPPTELLPPALRAAVDLLPLMSGGDYDGLYRWSALQELLPGVQGFPPYYEPKHRLLGFPDLVQGRLFDARFLFQVDSDLLWRPSAFPSTRMMWGDAGRVYYWLQDEDLRARNFDSAWTWTESS